MVMRCPLQREDNLTWIENRLAQRMWSQVAKHDANSGLWSGEAPLMGPTKKLHQKLRGEGRVQEAMALQAAVAHNVWHASRATDDPLFMQCARCNQGEEPCSIGLVRAPISEIATIQPLKIPSASFLERSSGVRTTQPSGSVASLLAAWSTRPLV